MSSACTDNLGYGCANDVLWHPCLFIFSCLSPLPAFRLCRQNGSCSNSVTLTRQGDWISKCLLSLKKEKKKKSFFFLSHFPDLFHSLSPPNSCRGRAAGALYCGSETGRRAGGWSETQKYLRPLLPPGTGRCSAAVLHSASSLAHAHGRTLGKLLGIPTPQYLDSLHCKMESPMVTQPGGHLSCTQNVPCECV